MTVTTSILEFLRVLFEIFAIAICLNLFGINNIKTTSWSCFIFALIVCVGGSIAYSFLIDINEGSGSLFSTFIYIVKLILPLILLCGSLNLKICYFTAIMEFGVSILTDSATCIISNVFKKMSANISLTVNLCVQIFILVLLLIIMKNTDTNRVVITLKMVPRSVFVSLLLTVLSLSALVSLIYFDTVNSSFKENLLVAIVIVLSVIIAHIIMSLFINVIARQHFTTTSQMMEKQVELQINHYKELEKMDAEMRRFRHDYTNHLRSVLSLIQMREYSDAEEYIEKIQNKAYTSGTVMFYTGNKLADAILADKSAALDEHCRIEYSGIMTTSIENVDLCIILSNALDNAVEACRGLDSPCVIYITAGERQGYFVMSMKNPTASTDSFYDIPATTKSEKEQHGMGLYNIESTAKKYDGQMKIKCENGMFELIITIKL